MEVKQTTPETESEMEAMTLQETQLITEIGEIRGLSEEINQSFTELRLQQPSDALASNAEIPITADGARQHPPTLTTKGLSSPRLRRFQTRPERCYPESYRTWDLITAKELKK